MSRGGKVRIDVRRDEKGRVLPTGISQRKDGRYIWRFMYKGVAYPAIYSWDLKDLKKTAAIRKAEILEEQFEKPSKVTLNQFFKYYMETYRKGDMKAVSFENTLNYWKWFIQDTIGKRQIQELKRRDFIELYRRLQTRKDRPITWNTVKRIHNIVENTLERAVLEDIIHKNPARHVMEDVPKLSEGKDREALTPGQVRRFLDYVECHRYYRYHKNFFIVLFGTGLRVGEACALMKDDVNLQDGYICVYKTLYYRELEGEGRAKRIGGTKSRSGTRAIPMVREVKRALKEQLSFWETTKVQCEEPVQTLHEKGEVERLDDSYSDFVFMTQDRTAYTPDYVTQIIKKIVSSYNRDEEKEAKEEGRKPELLPSFSAHYTRHTFATRAAEAGISMDHISRWLGHSVKEGSTTVNRYVHVNWRDKWKDLTRDLTALNDALFHGEEAEIIREQQKQER